jgi:inhibitor of KinA sporulation pathway (predicted exonuclease)
MNKKYLIVVDLEATCSDTNEIVKHEMETIEIGAVMVDRTTNEILSEFQSFIKPVKHPVLTEFCKTLTSITQEQIDTAPSFLEATNALKTWLSAYDPQEVAWSSWGYYDKNQIDQDCRYKKVNNPLNYPHYNLKVAFQKTQGGKKCGVSGALRKMNMAFIGTPHRGLDDAKNIARLAGYCDLSKIQPSNT